MWLPCGRSFEVLRDPDVVSALRSEMKMRETEAMESVFYTGPASSGVMPELCFSNKGVFIYLCSVHHLVCSCLPH